MVVHYYQPDSPQFYLYLNVTNGLAPPAPARGDQGSAPSVILPDIPV